MIKGKVNPNGTPVVDVRIIGRRGEIVLEGVLDTGFDGYICLPITKAVALGLELIDLESSELADGTILEDEPIFLGEMEWDGAIIEVYIVLTKSVDALIGTALLWGMDMRVNYATGELTIEKAQ